MTRLSKIGLTAAAALAMTAGAAGAQNDQHPQAPPRPAARAAAAPRQGETYKGPTRYQGVTAPQGWNSRPAATERNTYQHNYQAQRSYRVGPYRAPAGYR